MKLRDHLFCPVQRVTVCLIDEFRLRLRNTFYVDLFRPPADHTNVLSPIAIGFITHRSGGR